MLDIQQLETAVQIQAQSYQLLHWFGTAIENGVIKPSSARHYGGGTEAALQWITTHYENLPLACRPDREMLPAFANFFATYLDVSFELKTQTGWQRSSACGCYCPMCSKLVQARHLQARKVGPQDKRKAAKLRLERLEWLAREESLMVSDNCLKELADSPSCRRDVSLSAYGSSLLGRLKGVCRGPGVLALWREIAWNHNGSPMRGYQLTAEEIHEAEMRLIKQFHNQAQAD